MAEKFTAKATAELARTGMKLIDGMVKKAWSVIDAASEKKSPNEVISQKGVKNIQGFKAE